MASTDDTYALLGAFAQELARCGMGAACTSPGSRSAPLALSLAREPGLRCWSHIDERAASFFALGLAKATGLPVAVTCTSGTAAAQLHAAAVEAHEARVPLLLLTADRPAELREVGAGQAIDQLGIFGSSAKWFFEVSVHEAGPRQLRWMRTLACRAYATALEGRPGAVHLNFPLYEPLVPIEGETPAPTGARERPRPYLLRTHAAADAAAGARALREMVDGRRGIIVAGREERRPGLPEAAAQLARAAGWPLLADPLSGARRGGAAIAHYDALLRDGGFAESHAPEVVLRVGDLPVSKPLREWLEGLSAEQAAFDPERAFQDPAAVVGLSLAAEPEPAMRALAADFAAGDARPAPGEWLEGWRRGDALAAEALTAAIAGEGLCEPAVAAELGVLLPAEATLFVASSMPVRDIESFWPAREDPPRVLCNRGANGIDGTVSSAFGAAAAGTGPVVLLIGDVALAHDLGGLIAARRLGVALTIVLIDNGGGGIFDFLPVSRAPIAREPAPAGPGAAPGGESDIYTEHIATPTGLQAGALCAAFGIAHERAEDVPALRLALERALGTPGSCLIEVQGDRGANVAVHSRLWEAVARGLRP